MVLWALYPFNLFKHLAVTPQLLPACCPLWPSSWLPSPPCSEELTLVSSDTKPPCPLPDPCPLLSQPQQSNPAPLHKGRLC